MYMDKSIILCNNKNGDWKSSKDTAWTDMYYFSLDDLVFYTIVDFQRKFSRSRNLIHDHKSRLWQIVGHLFFLVHIFL